MFKVTYGRTLNGVHIEYTKICTEGFSPEIEYKKVQAFVEARFKELETTFSY